MKTMTCIICPRGCSISVSRQRDGEICTSGQGCPRGGKYAKEEYTAPQRILTTTVKSTDGGVLAVRTDRPIPKKELFSAMEIINKCIAPLPICAGDVIIRNIYGANLIATEDKGEGV